MRVFIGAVLAAFFAYTVWVAWEFGYASVFEVCLRQHPSTQALIDLWLCAGMLFFIMIADHKRNKRPMRKIAVFTVVTLAAGAIGPLLYFLVYPGLLLPKSDETG